MIKTSIISQNRIEKLIYNSIDDSIVAIDQDGSIRYVNEGWIEFAKKNSSTYQNWKNYNYLTECKRAISAGDKFAREAFQGICDVISRKRSSFYMEYPCNSLFEKQWFLMRVSEIKSSHSRLFLIRHTSISERKLAEEFIQDKNNAIIKAIPDIIFLYDKNGTHLECFYNNPSLPLLNINRVIGTNIADILPKELADKILFYIRKTLSEKNLNQFEYDIEINSKTRSFESRFVHCHKDKILSIVRDITERKATARELEKMRSRYSAIVEDQTELICRFSSDTTLTFVNAAYCNFFGKTKEELLGKQFITLLPEPDQTIVLNSIRSLTPEFPATTYRHQALNRNGKLRLHEWVDRAFFDKVGNIIEYQSVGRDITDRIAVEKELEKELNSGRLLRDEIKKRNEDLEKSNIELDKLNSTLKLMLNFARKTEIEIQERIVSNLRINILSLLEILKIQKLTPIAYDLIETLETNTKNLAQPLANKIDSLLLGLTTREMQLANFIRQGKTNKEIMEILNLSFQTVQSHRNNLRKKLGICKKKINLRTYLNSEFKE